MFGSAGLHESNTCSVSSGTQSPASEKVRLIHWWATGSEAAALDILKQKLLGEGVVCDDTPIAGGAKLKSELKSMVARGDIPSAVVMSGYSALDWAEQDLLADLSGLVESADWNVAVPSVLQKFCKNNDRWFGVPICVHSINWLWINRAAAEKIGLTAPPVDMDELFDALEKAKAAGIVPLAIGGQSWLMATLFDSIVVATNGADFYRRAFFELDEAILKSPGMIKAFENLATLASYADRRHRERNWSAATGLVVHGQALLEVSGDWAKAEYRAANKEQGVDYWCVRFPGTQKDVIFNADIIVMFKVEEDRQAAQLKLAKAVMDPALQLLFNDMKGAAPARTDVSDTGFDTGGKKAFADVKTANRNGKLMGAMSHGYAQTPRVQEAYFDIVIKVFHGEIAPEAAADALAASLFAALEYRTVN